MNQLEPDTITSLISELEREVREREAIVLRFAEAPKRIQSRYSRELRATRRKLAALDARRCSDARLIVEPVLPR